MNNLLSFSSVKLEFFSKDGAHLKPASGFLVDANGQYYLITNWHVVSGRNISVDEQQEPIYGPYTLKTSIHVHSGEGGKPYPISMGTWQRITISLYDDNNVPRWIEYRASEQHKGMIDMVALPIQSHLIWRPFSGITPGITINKGPWANDINYWTKVSSIPVSAIETDVEYGPPDAVHIIGYPQGWTPEGTSKSSSAFWRTSFIASEIYEHGMTRENIFFVDPSAPDGMTGSPVVGIKNDRLKLLGVYSDRSMEEFSAPAGLVYGAWLVKELIGVS